MAREEEESEREKNLGGPLQSALQAVLHEPVPKLQEALALMEEKLCLLNLLPLIAERPWLTLPHIGFASGLYVVKRFPITNLKALGPREQAVRDRIRDGDNTKTIAFKLKMSPRTVETHLDRLCLKFGVASRPELLVRIQQLY
jgi:DNA-binding CsgD family transcriptional regulator